MPVRIGAPRESDFTDPIGMLSDCHRRIERFLQALIEITQEVQGQPLRTEQRSALETSLRYFREAAPRHTADEEESLFPRLRRMNSSEAQAALARVDSLEQDHKQAERKHSEVERLGQEWLSRGQLPTGQVARLQYLLAELSVLYQQHIRIEDTEVFPSAKRLLSGDDRTLIGAEMAARRGLSEHQSPSR
jgi:hemerythrin-like domain-containing protein